MPDGSHKLEPQAVRAQRAYRLRVYPTREQRAALARHFGAGRFVWNVCLRARSEAYRDPELTAMFGRGLSIGLLALSRWLTELKREPEFAWLAEIDSGVIAQVLRDQERAFANFFAGRARYPKRRRFASRAAVRFVFDQRHAGKVKAWGAGELVLPLLGRMNVLWSRRPNSMPKLVTVSIDSAGRFFVSMAVEEAIATLPTMTAAIGVDVGLKHLATLSTGEKVENPTHLRRKLRHLKRLQRGLSRKKKGSGRYRAQRRRVGKLQAKIADCRRDAQHQASIRIVRSAQIVCLEDLNVAGMTQNRRLARAIADAGLAELHRQVGYKAIWAGRSVVKVGRWYPSSKTCSSCGAVNAEVTLSVRSWICPGCDAEHDRDLNAAHNIRAEGLRLLAGVGVARGSGDLMRVEGVRTSSPPAVRRRRRASVETRTGQPTVTPSKPAATTGVAQTRIRVTEG